MISKIPTWRKFYWAIAALAAFTYSVYSVGFIFQAFVGIAVIMIVGAALLVLVVFEQALLAFKGRESLPFVTILGSCIVVAAMVGGMAIGSKVLAPINLRKDVAQLDQKICNVNGQGIFGEWFPADFESNPNSQKLCLYEEDRNNYHVYYYARIRFKSHDGNETKLNLTYEGGKTGAMNPKLSTLQPSDQIYCVNASSAEGRKKLLIQYTGKEFRMEGPQVAGAKPCSELPWKFSDQVVVYHKK